MHRFIAPLLNHFFDGELKSSVKQMRLQAIICGIIGISLFISVIFLCIIGFIALCWVMKPVAAASIMFFIWLFITGVGVFVSKVLKSTRHSHQQKKLEEQRHKLMTDATVSGISLLSKHLPFSKFGVPVLGLMTYFLWKKDKKDHL
ncbi:phage holin family protein [Bartonella jaculi]|uniref:phage holin family protein n=1 Tax=Bartonella jaculi TaxID=686226 RepID=UPI0031EB04C3